MFELGLVILLLVPLLWPDLEHLTREAGGVDRYADTIRDLSVDFGGSLAGAALALVLARSAARKSGLDVMPAPAPAAAPATSQARA
jgi:hypothetical protein